MAKLFRNAIVNMKSILAVLGKALRRYLYETNFWIPTEI